MNNEYINEFAEKWIKTLEGKGDRIYEQGSGFLCCDDKFCCLGVAEDLAGTKYRFGISSGVGISTRVYCDEDDANVNSKLTESAMILTESTMNKLGLIRPNGGANKSFLVAEEGEPSSDHGSLLHANDCRETFYDIAQAIRANPEIFFHKQHDV